MCSAAPYRSLQDGFRNLNGHVSPTSSPRRSCRRVERFADSFTDAADIDLYLTDSPGEIVAKSPTTATTETITLTPPTGYRFPAGQAYTVWVHGISVPTPPMAVHLRLVGIGSTSGSVCTPGRPVKAIQPSEAVSVTLNFDKAVWPGGSPARV